MRPRSCAAGTTSQASSRCWRVKALNRLTSLGVTKLDARIAESNCPSCT